MKPHHWRRLRAMALQHRVNASERPRPLLCPFTILPGVGARSARWGGAFGYHSGSSRYTWHPVGDGTVKVRHRDVGRKRKSKGEASDD